MFLLQSGSSTSSSPSGPYFVNESFTPPPKKYVKTLATESAVSQFVTIFTLKLLSQKVIAQINENRSHNTFDLQNYFLAS